MSGPLRRLRSAVGGSRLRWRTESTARMAWPLVPLRLRRHQTLAMAYDLAASPLTAGDFLLFALVARLYQTLGARTELIVLDDKRREDSAEIRGAEQRLAEYEHIAAAVSVPGLLGFRRMSHADYLDWRQAQRGTAFYSTLRADRRRLPAYVWSWGVLEQGLVTLPRVVRDRFLLSADEIAANLDLSLPPAPYLTLAVRTGSSYGRERDVSRDEYARQVEAIRRYFAEEPIWIASDERGTTTIRSWAVAAGDVRYARDFGDTFGSSLALALGGLCYVQVRGGGLAGGVMFSRTPFFAAADHLHAPHYDALAPGDEYRPRWSEPLSVWCAADRGTWDSLDRFLARVSAARQGPVAATRPAR